MVRSSDLEVQPKFSKNIRNNYNKKIHILTKLVDLNPQFGATVRPWDAFLTSNFEEIAQGDSPLKFLNFRTFEPTFLYLYNV